MPHISDDVVPLQDDVARRTRLDDADERAREQHIRAKNRRKRYLDLHPEYFKGSNLELADPLLYDRLVTRFQTAEEREKEGKERGYSGNLEADLVRSEAKIEALQSPDPNSPLIYTRAPDGSITTLEQDGEDRAQSREDGWERWKDIMGQRFLHGADADFDYETVDENDDYDDREEEDRDRLDEYLEEEEEQFLGSEKPSGQTGVQDF